MGRSIGAMGVRPKRIFGRAHAGARRRGVARGGARGEQILSIRRIRSVGKGLRKRHRQLNFEVWQGGAGLS